VGIDLPRELMPDATTLLKFRRPLNDDTLIEALFDEINTHRREGPAHAHGRDDHLRTKLAPE